MTAIQERPVAWAVNHAHGTTVWGSEAEARKIANEWLASRVWVWAEVVPLYRQPHPTLTLTDAEREALRYVGSNVLPDGSREGDDALHAIRMLLKRAQ